MTAGTSLVVPIVLWGRIAPTHCVSCIYLSRDQKTLVTGCYDGQICLWQVDPETLKMSPRCLLVGHTAPIMCLSRASVIMEQNYIVSSSESGEMCTWDLVDGKCREAVKLTSVHTQMLPYVSAGGEDVRLFCSGYYPEVLVMDPFSLEVLFTLSSRVNPDWISALHVLRPAKRKGRFYVHTNDVVLALTTTGTVKVWTLLGHENRNSEPLYEHESKQIRCLNALAMTCCPYNQRTVLIVCSKHWQIYDAGDFSLLCSITAPCGERWMAGDFLSADRVILWSDEGRGYLYKLPAKVLVHLDSKLKGKALSSSVADNKNFHTAGVEYDQPYLYCTLTQPGVKPLSCPPAMRLVTVQKQSKTLKYLLRGDSGGVVLWTVPEVTTQQLAQICQNDRSTPLSLPPAVKTSITTAWEEMKPSPVGILDQLDSGDGHGIKLTASIYLPQQSRLVVGREDGSIIIVPATQTVMLQLLHGNHQQYDDWPPHQVLLGHSGRVNCLLYPHGAAPRYDRTHLVSGSVDFAVCLWDLYAGTLIHRFCVHAGEITQLMVPPDNCSPRIQKCVCSVASDHSVTLLSLAERKCVVLASRHLFPVVTIKWRPLDDFMIVGCSDGAVYVWQMETGHLDRVLHGIIAEEVLYACDENTITASGGSATGGELGLANPAVHFFRGLRHRNLSAIRHATQRGLHQLQQLHGGQGVDHGNQIKTKGTPLMIQGFRSNPKDPESHILFFDIEALIVQLLNDEYGAMSPGSLEAQGLISASEYQKVAALTQSASPDAHKKIAGDNWNNNEIAKNNLKRNGAFSEPNATMEVAQLILSLLHAWGIDPDLDRVCEGKLGLLRPMVPVSFGVLSKGGYMSLLLPTWQMQLEPIGEPTTQLEQRLPAELVRQERLTRAFTARAHWELSTTLTSNHLLAVVALANTLMSMNNATFVPEQERNRKMHRPGNRSTVNWNKAEEENEEIYTAQQAQIKQGWSLLATLHCVLLPDKIVSQGGVKTFKRPQVEMMARRWQHQCLEIREAAQALLLAELGRMGPKGRKTLVDSWSQYLPMYSTQEPIAPQSQNQSPPAPGSPIPPSESHTEEEDEEEELAEAEINVARKPSSVAELKRKQTTAVVLLGVIGAEFGQDVTTTNQKRDNEQRRKSSIVEGFGIGNNNLARHTSMALTHLLHAPHSPKLPLHTALRRAAIDLIGRGFTVWEPYLDVSKVLLGLLEMCCDADKLVPNMTYGLPLTPQADTCRTARHALTLIATARPAAFITTMAREVARYNTLQQNAQTLNVNMGASVLVRAKPEILRIVEQLIDKMQSEMSDLLVEVMDIILHCLDPGHLKTKPLNDVFPAVCRFNQVSHCPATRRIAVGSRNGQLALYELRGNVKCQTVPAHVASVTALAFSPEGKFLVSYSCTENKLCFWQQTSSGMFGLGNSQTRCVKSYSTAPINDVARLNPMRLARLIWINNRTVTLMLADGSETRFNV
ncbi:WD repeat-containing protein Rbcn-3B isoform X14 [Bombus vancouverensis nearcticus]|uniref:WD repeat-containing protein 7 isoform X14 n=2 Tax=Pyrobombus TaxID=144703 RepID=A0A6P8MP53_9HYME|nr:WD repeat-containing protein 7 isoform X16 [Bombus impatiens]XP_033188335.1 WD repeat-containing protein 7 isoform X14 [Bombus vancouverensis nearcticus]XP_033310113.1 WD repeat-containing protein 7 isoform X14 [Bombus bifarius]XP_050481738.1 WD repeat-containing protein 7 isoform X14 [Bombus huntii]